MRENLNFEHHRQHEQNHWDYSYYLIALMAKDKNDLNGFESYILEKYQNREISWFPIGQAIALKQSRNEEEIEDKLESIEERLTGIMNAVQTYSDVQNRDSR